MAASFYPEIQLFAYPDIILHLYVVIVLRVYLQLELFETGY